MSALGNADKSLGRGWSVVEVYVSNLRKVLREYGYEGYLKTLRNVGYMWSEKKQESREDTL